MERHVRSVGRSARRARRAVAALAVLAVLPGSMSLAGAEEDPVKAAGVTAASAADPILTTGGLLAELDVDADLNCYVRLLNDDRAAFYGETACATIVRIGSTLFSPSSIPAGSSAVGTTFAPASAPALSGTGSPEDPYRITTVVTLPGQNLRLTQVDAHVLGDNGYTTEVTLANEGGSAKSVEIYKGIDCYTADSDSGFGALLGTPVDQVQCIGVDEETGVRNRAESLIATTPADSYMHASYSQVWSAIRSGSLTNSCRCDEEIDNGMSLGWERDIAPGQSVTVTHRTEFRSPGQAVTNYRLLDTRPESQIGYSGAIPAPEATVPVEVAGRGGIPSSGAESVFLNITGTQATGRGFVTTWPSGQPQPGSSSLNLEPGQTRPNLVFTRVGDDGRVLLYTQSGTHLIADVGAYFPTGSAVRALPNPQRILDTRPGTQVGYTGERPGAGAIVPVAALGRAGVPDTGVSAVILNVTGTEAAAPGYVTVWPGGGQLRPITSNLNLEPSVFATPNLVVVPVGPDGTFNVFTESGAHLVVDVAGYVVPNAGFESVTPFRVLDTRPENRIGGTSGEIPGPGDVVRFQVAGVEGSGVPGEGVQSVILNVTATQSLAPGYVTAFPGGTPPEASNLNIERAGQTIANSVIVPVDSNGYVSLFTQSGGHLIADVAAWVPN